MWLIQWFKSNTERNEFGVPVRNFGKVTDEIYRGALPRAEGYRAIARRLGVRSVCSLTELEMESHRKLALESGVEEWRHIPFSDRAAPPAERVREWLEHVRAARTRGPVYTHCMGGRHRTGVLVGVFRVADCGWTREQALKEMLRHGWYDALGHRPLMDWFLHEFDPKDYAKSDSPGVGSELAELAGNV